MKQQRKLTIAGTDYLTISNDIRLQLKTPGRASFVVQGTPPNKGIVQFYFGYSGQQQHTVFIGYVERVTPAGVNHSHVFCRQLAAVLANPLSIALRNVTMREILAHVSELTALEFNVPTQAYADTKTHDFISLGTGYYLLDALAQVFDIPNYIWQQQTNGKIYAGAFEHSNWAQQSLPIPASFFTKHKANQSAEIAIIPAIRPGAIINNNQITDVQILDEKMVLKWKTL